MEHFAIRAKWICPIDQAPIDGGVIEISNGKVLSVGSGGQYRGSSIDLGDTIILPGFVNAHTHLEFSNCDRPLGSPGMSLVDWIRLVISKRGKDSIKPEDSILIGLKESIASGVTSLGDIATSGWNAYPQIVGLPEVFTFQEVIGFSRARADSAYDALMERMSPHDFGMSPHAPYTVGLDLLAKLLDHSTQNHLPLAMHLAESLEELELLAKGTGPFRDLLAERSMWDANAIRVNSRPLDYLHLLSKASRSLVIHGNYLEEDELRFLGEHASSMALVYCPRTHEYFGHPRYPLVKALALGVNVVLGTDSRASNPDLSILNEMRSVHTMHPEVSPQSILQMGTVLAAEAIGRDQLGSITPGKLANLVAIPLDDASHDPLQAILESNTKISQAWLSGHEVLGAVE